MKSAKKAVLKAKEKAAKTRKKAQSAKDSAADEKDAERVAAELMGAGHAHMNKRTSGVVEVSRIPDPRYLFKYASPERIWETLDSGLVYFANPLEFNDPHDARIIVAKNPESFKKQLREVAASPTFKKMPNAPKTEDVEKHLERICAHPAPVVEGWAKQLLNRLNMGVCCLSSKCASLPMWAHYAQNHMGGCLVFDLPAPAERRFPFFGVRPVEYLAKMPEYDHNTSLEKMEKIVDRHLLTKSEEWAYESEWRALMADSRAPASHQPSRFPPSFKGVGKYHHNGMLLGAILGSNMPPILRWMMHGMATERDLAIWKASVKIGEYGLNIEPCNARAQEVNLSANR